MSAMLGLATPPALPQEMFVLQERGADEEHTLNFTVPITEPLPPQHPAYGYENENN